MTSLISCSEQVKVEKNNDPIVLKYETLISQDSIDDELKQNDWFKTNNIDTIIKYTYNRGGQIDVYIENRCWWMKNGILFGENAGDLEGFKGFNILFQNYESLLLETPTSTATLSHHGYESIYITLPDTTIICSTDYLDFTLCPLKDKLASYISATSEKTMRLESGIKSLDSLDCRRFPPLMSPNLN